MSFPYFDPATGLVVLLKQLNEVARVPVDFSGTLRDYPLETIDLVEITRQGLVVGSLAVSEAEEAVLIEDGAQVLLKLEGGTSLEHYKVTVRGTDTDGVPHEVDGMLYVIDH